MAHKPTRRNPTEGRTIAVVGDVYRFLTTGEDTDGHYAQWEALALPGEGPPPHVHGREDEGEIKPANILIDRQGRAYLNDFEIAVVEEELLRDVTAAGTLPCMALSSWARGSARSITGLIFTRWAWCSTSC